MLSIYEVGFYKEVGILGWQVDQYLINTFCMLSDRRVDLTDRNFSHQHTLTGSSLQRFVFNLFHILIMSVIYGCFFRQKRTLGRVYNEVFCSLHLPRLINLFHKSFFNLVTWSHAQRLLLSRQLWYWDSWQCIRVTHFSLISIPHSLF